MRQPAPVRDICIEGILIQTVAPGSTNASINARDEMHITHRERTYLRGGLERYYLNRNSVIGGRSYVFSQLYEEHCEYYVRAGAVNSEWDRYMFQTTDIRQNETQMRHIYSMIIIIQALLREREDRMAKFKTALYARKLAEAESAELKEKNNSSIVPVEEGQPSKWSTSAIENWLRNQRIYSEEDSKTVTKILVALYAVLNGDFPNLLAALDQAWAPASYPGFFGLGI